jgi:hypothetical protein
VITVIVAAALVFAACGDDAADTTTSITTTTRPAPVGDLADDLAALVEIAEDVRGLEFLGDPVITILSEEELAQRVREDLEEEIDPDDIIIDQAFFELIGILDPGTDLAQVLTDLYAEQVAGFYDSDTKEMVIAGGQDLTPLGKTIVIHELIHALADQHFDLGGRMDALMDEERYHEASALLALAEGEATYFQIVYFQSLPGVDQLAAATESLEFDSTVLDSLPEWFGDDLMFPYDQGFLFVETLVSLNGIAAVDQAYGRLPTTVEQIIHPEAYRTFEPSRQVELPGNAIVPGYEIYEEGELGEWNLRLFLLDGVTDGDAIIGSAGWGGDDYRIMWDGTEVIFLYQYEGDTPRDAEELAGFLEASVGERMAVGNPSQQDDGPVTFRGDDYAWIFLDGSTVFFVAASDPVVGQTMAEVLTPSES